MRHFWRPLIDPPFSKSLDRLPRHTRLNPSASLRLLPNFGLASLALALGVILLGPFQHTLELTGCDQPIELGEAFRREQIERRLRGRRVCALGELASKIIDFRARAWSTEHMHKVDSARLYRWSLEPETLKFFPLRGSNALGEFMT